MGLSCTCLATLARATGGCIILADALTSIGGKALGALSVVVDSRSVLPGCSLPEPSAGMQQRKRGHFCARSISYLEMVAMGCFIAGRMETSAGRLPGRCQPPASTSGRGVGQPTLPARRSSGNIRYILSSPYLSGGFHSLPVILPSAMHSLRRSTRRTSCSSCL